MKLQELKGVLIADNDVLVYGFENNDYVDLFKGRLEDLSDNKILDKDVDAIFTNNNTVSILVI